MSLESDIQELTVAVRALTHALTQNAGAHPKEPEEVFDTRNEQDEAKEDPNVKLKPTTDISPISSVESRTVTYDDVKNVTIAVSKIDKSKAVAGLARFGVTTAKALNESQWLDYVVYMERVQKGEIDPEASHE